MKNLINTWKFDRYLRTLEVIEICKMVV